MSDDQPIEVDAEELRAMLEIDPLVSGLRRLFERALPELGPEMVWILTQKTLREAEESTGVAAIERGATTPQSQAERFGLRGKEARALAQFRKRVKKARAGVQHALSSRSAGGRPKERDLADIKREVEAEVQGGKGWISRAEKFIADEYKVSAATAKRYRTELWPGRRS